MLDRLADCPETVTVSFTYEDYEVEVDSTGNLTLTDTPETVSNVLVLDEECPDHPTEGRTPLYVTFSGTPQIESTTDATVIHVGDFCRGTRTDTPNVRIETVEDPSDLSELGTKIRDVLAEQGSMLVCFDSITDLLDHVGWT